MLRINVQADIDGLMSQFRDIRDPKPAVARAINKTMVTARAKTSQAIRSAGYNIKAGDIKTALKTNRKATKSLLVAYLDANGRPIPLIKYSASADRRPGGGVNVKVLNGRKFIQGAFIATMPSGHRGVFVRVGSAAHTKIIASGRSGVRAGRKAIAHRDSRGHGLPIVELFGPSVTAAFKRDTVQAQMEKVARERFPIVLRQELNFAQLKQH